MTNLINICYISRIYAILCEQDNEKNAWQRKEHFLLFIFSKRNNWMFQLLLYEMLLKDYAMNNVHDKNDFDCNWIKKSNLFDFICMIKFMAFDSTIGGKMEDIYVMVICFNQPFCHNRRWRYTVRGDTIASIWFNFMRNGVIDAKAAVIAQQHNQHSSLIKKHFLSSYLQTLQAMHG